MEDPLDHQRDGLPLSLGISAANLHDSLALQALICGIPQVRSRRGPRRRKPDKLHADKGYDYAHLRRWLREPNITPRIARKAPNFRTASAVTAGS
ncbi:transposase [Streptomyces bauhiniae]